jgi:DNA excision repair protein ERCC-3
MAWKDAELGGYISSVSCKEITVPLHPSQRKLYHAAGGRGQLRIAAENQNKLGIVKRLLRQHEGKPALVIGQYLKQLNDIAQSLNAPILTGEVPPQERAELYSRFKRGEISVLVVSKVANLAIDLPDAAVAIQLSGSFGSRQEEAQRIGRLLRPKAGSNKAWFYSIVTEGTKETQFALKRQLFMMEQGYVYERMAEQGEAEPVSEAGGPT